MLTTVMLLPTAAFLTNLVSDCTNNSYKTSVVVRIFSFQRMLISIFVKEVIVCASAC